MDFFNFQSLSLDVPPFCHKICKSAIFVAQYAPSFNASQYCHYYFIWQVGNHINQDIVENKRAEYAKQIVSTLSAQLKEQYGSNFELRNLRRMMQFAAQFMDSQIVVTLSRQLSWSYFIELLPIKKPEAQLFYANQVNSHLMNVRDLRKQIVAKTFERTAIAKI
ncbi:DUF1016 N-terminal domain-containing protein [Flavobacterium aquidurense]|uniref:DUF1016 N-terminal domain-containing protein n=1 Tax=Flavobacterium aquidurense TaxID=362413 RepID=UPI0037582157